MKRVSILFTAMILVAAGIFTSCEEEANMAPIITFTNGISSVDLEAGDTEHTITGTIEAEAGLDEVKIFQVTDAGETQLGSAITDFKAGSAVVEGADGITYNFSFDILGITDDIVVKVEATDKDNQTASKNFTITAGGAVAGGIETYTTKVLGAQSASTGSSFASIDGTVYGIVDAKANSAKVDFMYFYGVSNLATLAAPNSSDAAAVFNHATNGVEKWAVRNATKFGTTSVTAGEFDAMTDDALIASEASGLSADKVNMLSVGDVVAFETASTSSHASKKGLIKVTAISSTGADGSITITVKVQE